MFGKERECRDGRLALVCVWLGTECRDGRLAMVCVWLWTECRDDGANIGEWLARDGVLRWEAGIGVCLAMDGVPR